jgi:hypothetical protein
MSDASDPNDPLGVGHLVKNSVVTDAKTKEGIGTGELRCATRAGFVGEASDAGVQPFQEVAGKTGKIALRGRLQEQSVGHSRPSRRRASS